MSIELPPWSSVRTPGDDEAAGGGGGGGAGRVGVRGLDAEGAAAAGEEEEEGASCLFCAFLISCS